jgi:hypothetical protein
MIDDARCEGVRTVLAMCMLESIAPANGAELRKLVERIGLHEDVLQPRSTSDTFDEALAKLTAKEKSIEAKRLLVEAERRESAEACVGTLTKIYEPIIARMRSAFEKAQAAGLPLYGQFTGKSVADIFRSVSQPNTREQFFEFNLGNRGARMLFMVQAWHPRLTGFMPFSLHLILSLGPVPVRDRPPENGDVFLHDAAGTRHVVLDEREPKIKGQMTDDELTSLVTGWLLDGRVWDAVRRPLPEPPTS